MSQHVAAQGSSCRDELFGMEQRKPWLVKRFLASNGVNKPCISKGVTWPVVRDGIIQGYKVWSSETLAEPHSNI